ncbi:hypothetical protein PR001_g5916 [Phytophthora rubi]|uniref:Uncharacterized protein n=2 Tax=Phytophthora rubi TaxID=129364 RepID=A0A6A3NRR0_9STRA|nr:hypothetical protein PR001_g5916 [Phytophthora rubi]
MSHDARAVIDDLREYELVQALKTCSEGFQSHSLGRARRWVSCGMLLAGVHMNLDNEDENRKVNEISAKLGDSEQTKKKHATQIGWRVNPVVGGGTINATSKPSVTFKFGLAHTTETNPRL